MDTANSWFHPTIILPCLVCRLQRGNEKEDECRATTGRGLWSGGCSTTLESGGHRECASSLPVVILATVFYFSNRSLGSKWFTAKREPYILCPSFLKLLTEKCEEVKNWPALPESGKFRQINFCVSFHTACLDWYSSWYSHLWEGKTNR